jgi:hypothetical protein
MAFRTPRRPGDALLRAAALAAGVSAAIGCNVYDDELLRAPANGRFKPDASGLDDVANDGSSIIGTPGDANDASALDAPAIGADVGADRSVTERDASPSDSGTDAGSPRPAPDGAMPDGRARDATLTSDAPDAALDAPTGPRDADASSPSSDATDAALGDAGAGDRGAPDTIVSADVANDGGLPPPTFRVVRVGDGTTELSAASAPAFIEERRWDGVRVGMPLALPTSASAAQQPLTLSGIATSEGALSLSLDGRYLAVAGYATPPGRDAVASSSNVDRVIARIDADGAIDTSTVLGEVFSGSNARSAASVDGTAFWVGGSSGGIWYAGLGGTNLAQIVASPDNVRLVALFGDRLYGCSGTSPMATVFTVGNGRPTTGVQSAAPLAGLPRSGTSPYAFVLFDRSSTVAGLDTLYLTDDRNPESDGSGGGIQKWTFDGNQWSRVATFTIASGTALSFRGVTGAVTGSVVTLVASTAESSVNRLVVFVDDGSPTVTGITIATAPGNTVFRGVALSPRP